jgi:hypothetical protein
VSDRVVDFEAKFVDLQPAAAATTILNSARDIPSPCEQVMLGKAQLLISTTIHDDATHVAIANESALEVGSSVHDSATVGNIGVFTPANPVVFTFFRGSVCDTGAETAGSHALGPISAGSATADPSSPKTNLGVGQYSFLASIADDTNYVGATSDCEPFTVTRIRVIKTETVGGVSINPLDREYSFRLTGGPDEVDITKTTCLDDDPMCSGALDFGHPKPGTYTMCELAVPAGTQSTLEDLDGFQGGTVTVNATTGDVCLNDFTLTAEDKVFSIDNSMPGGGQRTIG